MLPKSERLTKEDFLSSRPKIFFRGEFFDVATLILPTRKFACVISKKTFKKAVDRNSVKRRFLNATPLLELLTKYSIIFYPKKTSKEISYTLLVEEIKKVFATLQ